MASRVCGFCKVPVHMEIRWFKGAALPSGQYTVQGAYECMHCHAMSVATVGSSTTHAPTAEVADQIIETHGAIWAPEFVSGREFPDVPPLIASAANEAYRCASIGAHRGAVLLARTSIEATAKAKDITTGNLLAKIDKMVEESVIRRIIADGAHEVRHLGNDMAHGDLGERIERADVDDVLELMALVLQEAFETEARVGRVRQRRTGSVGG